MLNAGHPVDVADNRGWRPLHDAAASNYINCLELILQNGLYCIKQILALH